MSRISFWVLLLLFLNILVVLSQNSTKTAKNSTKTKKSQEAFSNLVLNKDFSLSFPLPSNETHGWLVEKPAKMLKGYASLLLKRNNTKSIMSSLYVRLQRQNSNDLALGLFRAADHQ